MEHVVYCDSKAKVLDKILAGTKTMIIRGAAGRKLPHGRVFEGETLYFIENNGDSLLKAKAIVTSVFNSGKMTEDESTALVMRYQPQLNLNKDQEKRWAGKKYLCLIGVMNVEKIEPKKLSRQDNMDDWITIENIDSIIEGSSEKYHSIRLKN